MRNDANVTLRIRAFLGAGVARMEVHADHAPEAATATAIEVEAPTPINIGGVPGFCVRARRITVVDGRECRTEVLPVSLYVDGTAPSGVSDQSARIP